MKPRILVLSLGWEQVPMLDRLASKDLEIYGVHYNEEHYQDVGYRDRLLADMLDLDSILAFAEKIQPTAVISDQDDYAYLAQAAIADRFHLPGPTPETALLSTNKFEQRKRCVWHGIRCPEFTLASTLEDVHRFASSHSFPLIIKPVDNRGSIGVSKINEESEIEAAYKEALQNSVSGDLIIEQFIVGDEITIDGYCFNGQPKSLALALKGKISEERQVSIDIKYPGEVDPEMYQRAMLNNEQVCNVLGFSFGMTHSEYIIAEDNEIYLVEAANRGGGCFTSEIIVPQVCGIDILEEFVDNCLGTVNIEKPPSEIEQREVILKFITLGPGKIRSFDGVDRILNDDAVLKFRMGVKEEDEILPVTNDANRHGFVIVTAERGVRKLADEIINSLTVSYY